MEKEYKYDAFISYRHSNLDKFVAENLHKVLETYELPKNIKEKLNIKGRTIKRVFRDQDELPLSSNLEDPIVDALNNSKYLIVICTPRLKDSLWCKKEIETFKKLRGRKNIFCVLAEGEPNESFPEDVLYDEVETTLKNGKKKKEKVLVEPLAADVRGENKKEVLNKIKEEKLRLIAPMYNFDYDDLKQRHRQRKMKKIIHTSIIISAICVLFTLYSLFMLLKITSQQKTLKKHQALSLVKESSDYLKNDSRLEAIKSAYNSLTKFNGVKMPYTPDAEYALVESLGVYNSGTSYKAMSELNTKGVIDYVLQSSDSNYALTADESEELILWDLNKMKSIVKLSDINIVSFSNNYFTFVGNEYFAYIAKNGSVKIVSIKTGKVVKEIKKIKYSYKAVASSIDGSMLAINDSPNLYIYDLSNYNLVGNFKIDKKDEISGKMMFTSDNKKLFISATLDTFDMNKDVDSTFYILNAKDASLIDKFTLKAKYVEDIKEKDSNVYILSNSSVSNSYKMLITSYSLKNNKVNYTKTYNDAFGTKMVLGKAANNIALIHSNVAEVVSASTGELIRSFALQSDIIGSYASFDKDMYIAFTTGGIANFLSLEYKESIVYNGLFELNLDKYKYVLLGENGYFLIPTYTNRIIFYEQNQSKNIKALDIKLDYVSDEGLKPGDVDKIKKDYDIKNKNLVKKIIYADSKKLLIVSYNDNTAAIYKVDEKKYITTIKDVDEIYHDFGKDKNNRLYVGSLSNTYILDKDYNKVGHIKNMAKLDKDNNKVIITNNGKYYSLPIYTLNDLLKEAKNILGEK